MTDIQERLVQHLHNITDEQEDDAAKMLYGDIMPDPLLHTIGDISVAATAWVADGENGPEQITRMAAVISRMVAVGFIFRELEFIRALREEVIS
jgi:hypothetical protein